MSGFDSRSFRCLRCGICHTGRRISGSGLCTLCRAVSRPLVTFSEPLASASASASSSSDLPGGTDEPEWQCLSHGVEINWRDCSCVSAPVPTHRGKLLAADPKAKLWCRWQIPEERRNPLHPWLATLWLGKSNLVFHGTGLSREEAEEQACLLGCVALGL